MKLIELPNGDFVNLEMVAAIVVVSGVINPTYGSNPLFYYHVRVLSETGGVLSGSTFSDENSLVEILKLANEYKKQILETIMQSNRQ